MPSVDRQSFDRVSHIISDLVRNITSVKRICISGESDLGFAVESCFVDFLTQTAIGEISTEFLGDSQMTYTSVALSALYGALIEQYPINA